MHVFPIRTYPWRAFAVISGALTGTPLALIALALVFVNTLPTWLFIFAVAVAVGFLLSVNVALVVLALYVATRNEVTIREGTMHLKGGEFHERVPLDSVIEARIVDPARETALRGLRRRNGMTLPGFRVGWYQARDDRKVFVIRAGQRQAVYVRTRIRFDVLLGVTEAKELAERLVANTADDRD